MKTMQINDPKGLDIDKIDRILGGSMASEIRRMEQERASWIRAVTQSHSLAEQMKKLVGETSIATQLGKQAKDLQTDTLAEQMKRLVPENSAAIQVAKQWQEAQKAERESMRGMFDHLQDIRSGLLAGGAPKRILDDFAKSFSASEQMTNLLEQTAGSSSLLKAMHSSIEYSMESVRKILADASVSSGIGQLMKSFEATNKRWVVPQPLLEALGPLQVLQEQMGRLSLPVMDAASAATLGWVLGPEGIQAQLSVMGINPDGSINTQLDQQEEGVGLSRRTLELMPLLSFILAVLVPLYQEFSSSHWHAATDKTLAAQTEKIETQGNELEVQRNMIQALTKLVEKALVEEAKRQEEMFVVRDRVAVVRSKPEHGPDVEGRLLPREVVRLISESGKWIEFEYYHWLSNEHRTGWALKKYFQRVPTNFEKHH